MSESIAGILNQCYRRIEKNYAPYLHSYVYESARLFLLTPRGEFHGKVIYLTGENYPLHEKQSIEIDHFARQGYAVELTKGLNATWDAVESYLTWGGD